MAFPSRQVAIVGVHLTQQAPSIDRSSASLQIESFKGALDDAGLKPSDVDGILQNERESLVGGPIDPYMFWPEQLGQQPIKLIGHGHPAASLTKAAVAINAGLCEVVVLVHGFAGRRLNPSKVPTPTTDRAPRTSEWQFSIWGHYMSTWYAIWAQRYMHEFGVKSEQLAEVAVAARYHATLNPASIMGRRGPISVEDVVNSRMIASPLHLLDCCIDNDGGYGIVITSAERAKSLKKKPIFVLGGGEGIYIDGYLNGDINWFSGAKAVNTATETALKTAGVTLDDLDFAELYDCFTITTIRDIEEMGFCKAGEGPDFIQGGTIRLGGKLPTNTHGGLLSCSHNGYPGGMHVIEAVKQLRGNEVEPARQVKDPKLGIVLNQGMAVHGYTGVTVLSNE